MSQPRLSVPAVHVGYAVDPSCLCSLCRQLTQLLIVGVPRVSSSLLSATDKLKVKDTQTGDVLVHIKKQLLTIGDSWVLETPAGAHVATVKDPKFNVLACRWDWGSQMPPLRSCSVQGLYVCRSSNSDDSCDVSIRSLPSYGPLKILPPYGIVYKHTNASVSLPLSNCMPVIFVAAMRWSVATSACLF
jgi:hypothetical protein